MKRNTNNHVTLRLLAARLSKWMHRIIEKKGEHIADCGWYPGPCQTRYPF